MTTCVYCKKDINVWGDYEEHRCVKLESSGTMDTCEKCKYFIPEGKEVPVVF